MTSADYIVAAVWSVIAAAVVDLDLIKTDNDGPIGSNPFHASIQMVPTPTCGGPRSGCIITPSICMSRGQAANGPSPRIRRLCLG